MSVSSVCHAAACCTSATAFGTGRLLLWESMAFGLRSNAIHEVGFFDDAGLYEANGPSEIDQRFRLDAYTMIGLSEAASLFVVIPWLVPRVRYENETHLGFNISDIQLGYRHQVIAIGEYEELPSLAVTASLLIPTGAPRQLGTRPEGVTGRDALALSLGTSLERTWMPYFLQLNFGTSLLFNNFRTGLATPTPISANFQTSLAGGMELFSDVVISVLSQWTYETVSKYKTDLGFSASWRLNPHFTLQTNVSTDFLLSGFAANWPGSFSYGLGVRYGYF